MVTKIVRCTCGVEVQVHAREAHALPLSDEQVRAMMFIDQDGETTTAPPDA